MSVSERNTHAFKVGYWHARDRRPPQHTRENDNMTFFAHDYIEGWEAFHNEQYWDAVRENRSRDQLKQQLIEARKKAPWERNAMEGWLVNQDDRAKYALEQKDQQS